nr:MAG TPA: hypothetical protein [Caudoviricetes sp.]
MIRNYLYLLIWYYICLIKKEQSKLCSPRWCGVFTIHLNLSSHPNYSLQQYCSVIKL